MKTPVTFEVAKLLKEKGFDEPCNSYTSERDGDFFSNEKQTVSFKNYNEIIGSFSRPTIADVAMWLEGEHHIWVSVLCDCGSEKLFVFKIYSTEPGEEICLFNSEKNYNLPREAYEAAIGYTLNQLL